MENDAPAKGNKIIHAEQGKRAKVHLIVGYMGFGKTTLARRLEQKLPALRLTHDEFMCRLYGRNMPEAEFRAAWIKVDDFIWTLTERAFRAGNSVILDYGFWSRDSRRRAVERATAFGAEVVVHQLLCDRQTACARVLKRTAAEDDSLIIDRNCFEKFWLQYEPVDSNEPYTVINYDSLTEKF